MNSPVANSAANDPKQSKDMRQFCCSLMILLFACELSYAGTVPDDATPLSKAQVVELLGSERSSPLTWKKVSGPDCDVYYGTSSTDSGAVGIYLGGFPSFERDASLPQIPGRLGMYSVIWQKKENADLLRRETVIALHSDYWKAYVWIVANRQEELDLLMKEISELPMFNKMPRPVGAP